MESGVIIGLMKRLNFLLWTIIFSLVISSCSFIDGYETGEVSFAIPRATGSEEIVNCTVSWTEAGVVKQRNFKWNNSVSSNKLSVKKIPVGTKSTFLVYVSVEKEGVVEEYEGISEEIKVKSGKNSVTVELYQKKDLPNYFVHDGSQNTPPADMEWCGSYTSFKYAVDGFVNNTDQTEAVIWLGADRNIDSGIEIPEGKKLTVKPYNSNVVLTRTGQHYFTVKGELTLEGNGSNTLTVTDTDGQYADYLFNVCTSSSVLNLKNNFIVDGCTVTNALIYLGNSGSTFNGVVNMRGAVIRNCIMQAVQQTTNSSYTNPLFFHSLGGVFHLEYGLIENNTFSFISDVTGGDSYGLIYAQNVKTESYIGNDYSGTDKVLKIINNKLDYCGGVVVSACGLTLKGNIEISGNTATAGKKSKTAGVMARFGSQANSNTIISGHNVKIRDNKIGETENNYAIDANSLYPSITSSLIINGTAYTADPSADIIVN